MDSENPEGGPELEGDTAPEPEGGDQPTEPEVESTPEDVKILDSGLNAEMQAEAITLAKDAIQATPHEKMRIAHTLMTAFEEKYGSQWCCIVSDNELGFYCRYDPEFHIYCVVNGIIIFLFKTQT